MSKVVIKTADGNRYEVKKLPGYMHMYGITWLELKIGTETKYVNPKLVVSITEREEE